MIYESFNVDAAHLALEADVIETRICVSIKPETEVFRFVVDTHEAELGGVVYKPVPYAQFTPVTSSGGNTVDTATITLDGSNIYSNTDQSVDSVLQSLLRFPLRDRPVQIGLVVLNPETKEPIGLIPEFVGFVDNAALSRKVDGSGVGASKFEINIVSFRGYASRRTARVYGDTDHQSRFPFDRCARWISSAVARGGTFPWNDISATSTGTTGGGGGREPFNPNINYR